MDASTLPVTQGFADRSDRGKLRFTGQQRAWFLHQILTQSFEDMAPGESRDAVMITAHGRMLGYLETVMTEEAILGHFEPELRESLPEGIRRYVFATQVEVEDVTDEMGLVLITGEGWNERLSGAAPAAVAHPTGSLGIEAGYGWLPRAELADALEVLRDGGSTELAEEQLETLRVAHGIPRWGREMDTKTFPQEVGIDDRAVHYDKGCYLGQEAMAKIHFRGKVNRRLARLSLEGRTGVGTEVVADGTTVGRVTSVADGHALALVKASLQSGARVSAGDAPAQLLD